MLNDSLGRNVGRGFGAREGQQATATAALGVGAHPGHLVGRATSEASEHRAGLFVAAQPSSELARIMIAKPLPIERQSRHAVEVLIHHVDKRLHVRHAQVGERCHATRAARVTYDQTIDTSDLRAERVGGALECGAIAGVQEW
jgi:hypothetical protein